MRSILTGIILLILSFTFSALLAFWWNYSPGPLRLDTMSSASLSSLLSEEVVVQTGATSARVEVTKFADWSYVRVITCLDGSVRSGQAEIRSENPDISQLVDATVKAVSRLKPMRISTTTAPWARIAIQDCAMR